MDELLKECYKCLVTKPLCDFYKHKSMADGHGGKCKECHKAGVRRNYKENAEHYKEYQKRRANSEAGKKSIKERRARWVEKNPIKKKAANAVNNAIRIGKLSKPDRCEDCDALASKIHGHHDDYSKPLTVRWLCPACHKQWHEVNGEGINGK